MKLATRRFGVPASAGPLFVVPASAGSSLAVPASAGVSHGVPASAGSYRKTSLPASSVRSPNAAGGGRPPSNSTPADEAWKAWVCPQVRPLWTLTGATAWLRCSSETVLRWVEEGRLEWAWDIALGPARRRREIRIWFRALEACKAGRPLPSLQPAQVVAAVIGHQRETLRGNEAQAILNCERNLIARLLAAGELRGVGLLQAGPRRHVLLRASLANFLLRRRIH